MTYISISPKNTFDTLFKDKQGKTVIWQFPNIPLMGWIVFTLLAFIVKRGKWHAGLHNLARAFLFTWAYLEVKSGSSVFRRVLGGIVLVGLIIVFFI